MTLDEVINQCINDSQDWFPDVADNIPFLSLAMSGEAGEVANEAKKIWRTVGHSAFRVDEVDADALKEEIVDTFIYMMNLIGLLEMDIIKEYEAKRAINVERFGR